MVKIHDSREKLDIHDSRKKGINTWPFYKRMILYYQNNKKTIKKIFIVILLLSIIFFPQWSGSLIGNWVKDFIGTILDIIKTI